MHSPSSPTRAKLQMQHSKSTGNKEVWLGYCRRMGADRKGSKEQTVNCSLYIPRWRVPEPFAPLELFVCHPNYLVRGLSEVLETEQYCVSTEYETLLKLLKVTSKAVQERPALSQQPIVARVRKDDRFTETISYVPDEGDKGEVGTVYLPKSITFGEAEELVLVVKWGELPPRT